MTTLERVEKLRKEAKISQGKLERELGFSNGSISKWKNSTPTYERLQKVANFFNVSIEYLASGEEEKKDAELNSRDERDNSRRLEQTLEELETQQGGLKFDGQPLDDETKELLKASLEHSIRVAKINAKKYTPKKYLKDE